MKIQNKKVLIAFLSVLILGTGSVWFLGRDSSSSNSNFSSSSSSQRRVREVKTESDISTRRVRLRPDRAVSTSTRRKQEDTVDKTSNRRKPGRRSAKVKKKKVSPAA